MKSNLFRTEALAAKRDHGSQSTLQLRVHHNSYYTPVLIGIALITLVMWTLYADIPRTVEVSGAIIPSERPALITAQKSGIVSSLRVRDGQRVTAGQILAEVNIDSNIGGSGLSARLTELNESQLELYTDEKRQQAEAADIVSRAGTQQVDALIAERKILLTQIELSRQKRDILKSSADKIKKLIEKGFITQIEVDRRDLLTNEAEGALLSLERQLQSINFDIIRRQGEILKSRNDAGLAHLQLNGQIIRAKSALVNNSGDTHYYLRATKNGAINGMQVSEGSFVTQGRVLFQIEPPPQGLRAQLLIPTMSSTLVERGGSVRVRFDAYPFEHFGSLHASISSVSQTAIDPKDLVLPFEVKEPVMIANVVLPQAFRSSTFKVMPLKPGMTLKAVVTLEKRTVFEWLLGKPIALLHARS